MKCSQCLGPLRVARTRLNGKPVYEPAVTEERLRQLESLYESVNGVLSDAEHGPGEIYILNVEPYEALREAAERLENGDRGTNTEPMSNSAR